MNTPWLRSSLVALLAALAPHTWAQPEEPRPAVTPTGAAAEATATPRADVPDEVDEHTEADERRERRRRRRGKKEDVRFGSSVRVAAGETNENEIVVMGGTADIEGKQKGDVVVIGGSARVSGEVDGSVVVIGGPLELDSTANIERDAVAIGGPLNKKEGATVGGDTVSMGGLGMIPSVLPNMSWDFGWGSMLLMSFASWLQTAFLALLLTIVITAVMPARVEATAAVLSQRWFPSFGAGGLGWIGSWLLAGLLVLTCIGCVLAPFPILFYKVAKYFGMAALFVTVGQSMGRTGFGKELTLLPSLLLGYLLLSLIGLLLPFAWWLYTFLGAGAAILTRFGTMRPWFRPSTPVAPPPSSTTLTPAEPAL